MPLSEEQIETNKNRFIELIQSIEVEGADIQGLLKYLERGDFFHAPASTLYHNNYEGGLCEHSLHVYDTLVELVNRYKPGCIDPNSILIVGLLHDISKTNFYEQYYANKKVYNESGSKHDNLGKFDWVSEAAYKVKDPKDRFLGGTHGFNSMIIAGKFFPLTYEENLSLLHHHAGMGEESPLKELSAILEKYPLVTLLHTADFLSTYILEKSNA